MEKEQAPEIVPELDGAKDIQYVITDLDNNLWDWVGLHARAMDAMATALSTDLGIDYEEVRASMQRVYGAAGTLDFSGLVENMDIIHAAADEVASQVVDEDRGMESATRKIVHSGVIVKLLFSAFMAFEKTKRETFSLYPGIEDVFRLVTEARKEIIVLTDAPYLRALGRLKYFGLEKYISALYGQRHESLDFVGVQQNPDQSLNLQRQAIRNSIPYLDKYFQEIAIRRGESGNKFPLFVIGGDESKPNVDLSDKLSMSHQDIAKRLVVWGDNPAKDGGLACAADVKRGTSLAQPVARAFLYSDYGQTRSTDTANLLAGFGSVKEVSRNLSSGEQVLAELSELQDSLGRQTRSEIIRITHPIQILDVLGISRP